MVSDLALLLRPAPLLGRILELLSTACRDSVATIAKIATVDTLFASVDTISRQKWLKVDQKVSQKVSQNKATFSCDATFSVLRWQSHLLNKVGLTRLPCQKALTPRCYFDKQPEIVIIIIPFSAVYLFKCILLNF